MYVQFQIPATEVGAGVAGDHGARLDAHRRGARVDARWARRLVSRTSCARASSTYVVDQSGRGRSGFDQSVLHEAEARIGRRRHERCGGADSELRTDYRQRCVDHVVRPSHAGGLEQCSPASSIRHGDPADPDPKPDAYAHVAPLFPIDAVDPAIVARSGAIGPAPAGSSASYALEYYKQLVPNAEVTLPGSTCATCDPTNALAGQHVDAAEPRAARRASWRRHRGDAFAVGHHGTSHGADPQGARPSRSAERADHDRRIGCSLPNSGLSAADFDTIPYLALKGDYTATSAQCQQTVDGINARRANKAGNGARRST